MHDSTSVTSPHGLRKFAGEKVGDLAGGMVTLFVDLSTVDPTVMDALAVEAIGVDVAAVDTEVGKSVSVVTTCCSEVWDSRSLDVVIIVV